jgi:sugar phosphate isomerase/epimerase
MSPSPSPFPLPYCLNVHDASTWPAVQAALETHALAVKRLVASGRPFPLSLHLGAKAATQLLRDGHLESFADWLRRNGCFVAAINAFPYGRFHGRSVKAKAYRPDWRKRQRLRYTETVASILALLTPIGGEASLTTVPGGWLPDWCSCNDPQIAIDNLIQAAEFCRDLQSRYDRRIRIAIEPEPGCAWELFDPCVEAAAPEIGWCLDACHAAVDFLPLDDLDWSRIVRVQLSAAIECDNVPAARAALKPFVEPRYLHQTRAAFDGEIVGEWPDLAPALRALPKLPERAIVRTHYHVPLTWPGDGPLRSTRHTLTPAFFSQARRTFCEVETYTYSVVPAPLRPPSLANAIAAELLWSAERLAIETSGVGHPFK